MRAFPLAFNPNRISRTVSRVKHCPQNGVRCKDKVIANPDVVGLILYEFGAVRLVCAFWDQTDDKTTSGRAWDGFDVEGGSKWRCGAAEFGGAGLVKVSLGQLGVAVVV